MFKKSLQMEFLSFKVILAAVYLLVVTSTAMTMPSVEETSPWNNQVKNAKTKQQQHGKISPVKITTMPSSSTTTFKPKQQSTPKFVHREPQWVPGNDQMQIESAPNNKYGGYPAPGYPMKRFNKGFDLTTLVAVSLVSALLGALTFSVVDGSVGKRAIGDGLSMLNLIDAESVTKLLSSFGDLIGKTEEASNTTGNSSTTDSTTTPTLSRSARSTQEASSKTSVGIVQWFRAYKKDPNDLRCIQKLICETLASSACAARSVNSEIGGTVMNLMKYFVGSAANVSDMIQETVGNPKKCDELTPYDFCNDDGGGVDVKPAPGVTATPFPNFNLTSITPRLKNTN